MNNDDEIKSIKTYEEDIELAVEIIRQLEDLSYGHDTILSAMKMVFVDTLRKMKDTQRECAKTKLINEIKKI